MGRGPHPAPPLQLLNEDFPPILMETKLVPVPAPVAGNHRRYPLCLVFLSSLIANEVDLRSRYFIYVSHDLDSILGSLISILSVNTLINIFELEACNFTLKKKKKKDNNIYYLNMYQRRAFFFWSIKKSLFKRIHT